VEHVVSGQYTHFDSLEELLAFVRRLLRTVRAQKPEGFQATPDDVVEWVGHCCGTSTDGSAL
jgi:hypothetical protein